MMSERAIDFMVHAGLLFALPAFVSLCLTPGVIRLATAVGALDIPNERKIHHQPTPRLGGLAICVSFLFSLFLLSQVQLYFASSAWITSEKGVLFIAALLVVFLLGVWDDLRQLGPGRKFIVQIVAATIAYSAGFRISSITSPWGFEPLHLGLLDYPVTILWIVGVSNAFNLIDGLDGLASGVGIIASLTMFAVSFMNGNLGTAFPALCLAGAITGFLWYNYHPARIFLGDSGSLLIGFSLAVLSMQSSTKGSTAFALLVPLLALGLPIMDTLLSMVRRLLHSLLPGGQQSHSVLSKFATMFLPDRKHIHHQLLALGVPQSNVVLLLYCVSLLLGCGAFAVTVMNNVGASLILVAVAIATIAGIRQLRYREMAILRNGIFLPIYEWPVFHRSFFQGFIDLAFSAAAFTGAVLLSASGQEWTVIRDPLLMMLPVVCGVQIAVFYLAGLYNGTYQYLGIGDLLKIVKTVAWAVLATGAILFMLPQSMNVFNATVLLNDFYLLLTFVAGTRASFHILNYLFRREQREGKKLLIYGANTQGVLALQRILHDDSLNLMPIGFLDDKPSLEGKLVNGYPVYGGHWKIPQIVKKYRVEQILLSSETVAPELLSRLQEVSEKYGIALKQSKLLLEDIPKQPHQPRRPVQTLFPKTEYEQPMVGLHGS